jgi:hypothetical protein
LASLRKMFSTAARRFGASAWRSAESIGQIETEAARQTAINISKAQGVGQRGFIDGTLYIIAVSQPSLTDTQQSAKPPSSASRDSPKRPAAMSSAKQNFKTPVAA